MKERGEDRENDWGKGGGKIADRRKQGGIFPHPSPTLSPTLSPSLAPTLRRKKYNKNNNIYKSGYSI